MKRKKKIEIYLIMIRYIFSNVKNDEIALIIEFGIF